MVLSGGPEGDDLQSEVTESAEAAYLAEARARGETIVPAPALKTEEIDTRPLPPLDELVTRIPPEVRASLDDLFRAKFIAVRRVPKTALKS